MNPRISPDEAHDHLESGNAMLVCAYDSEEKFRQNHLEGAISLDEFRHEDDTLPQNYEVIFYCA